MGTNYYHFKEKIKEGDFPEGGLHIGKNSAGWVFHFEAHEYPRLKTAQDYQEFLKEGVIYNEYDEEVSYEEFWKIVEESKEDYYGKPPYDFENLPEDGNTSSFPLIGIAEWMDEGFMFTANDFC